MVILCRIQSCRKPAESVVLVPRGEKHDPRPFCEAHGIEALRAGGQMSGLDPDQLTPTETPMPTGTPNPRHDCAVPRCSARAKSHGICTRHYQRAYKRGQIPPTPEQVEGLADVISESEPPTPRSAAYPSLKQQLDSARADRDEWKERALNAEIRMNSANTQAREANDILKRCFDATPVTETAVAFAGDYPTYIRAVFDSIISERDGWRNQTGTLHDDCRALRERLAKTVAQLDAANKQIVCDLRPAADPIADRDRKVAGHLIDALTDGPSMVGDALRALLGIPS